ncbi:NADH-quinone oxidoreductase subunit L [Magnetospirillum molischianum]|uniref:NADH-quinone oxidoreductase chain L (NADH dehydrogenase I, chain L) (NDH-1, chain L) n=1 Tax=Magnetospirillum molischianum DSM 120 TaxID=1150626 RepID=H8FSL5_MAGML|nr:NADH-quinone oxidoreductase subunit L [Magnetospirillum molischianum]CCG41353.1 NADH-quinone oxidoreductase chain L (NADH dehydrogenase I, chain L) (NDH-1, chain L) [Magnetospirillum molischianum DSM 120]
MTVIATVFLPLLGAVAAGLFGRVIGARGAQIVTTGLLVMAAVSAALVFDRVALGGQTETVILADWIRSGGLDLSWALKVDTLTAVMLVVVTWVSAAVHLYSIGYMAHDPSIPRFHAYLSLFTFAMLMLVTADNLVQLFFGWEGVGLASYLLIGFWYEKPSASAAAIKAFIVNRVGDFAFLLGIFGLFALFGTIGLDAIFAAAAAKAGVTTTVLGLKVNAITVCCLLLFVGAMGKSAQLGLHTWLPDAMEGPTPVSALIHAATMVTAGVFLVARMSPLFELSDAALAVVTVVGAATAIFAATIGCVQNDIKRIIAYSTCSQLGYMFFALGVSAYQAAIFHLMTHAFFKALLFLAAGSVIHAMSDEQDIRRMGGIWKHVKVTWALMWVGSLALAGIPFFAGYYSKDIILEAAWAAGTPVGQIAYWVGILAAVLTAFYSWRLLLLTFHGRPRADEQVMAHVHESPAVMIVPLLFLGAGAMFAGWIGYDLFVGPASHDFWGRALTVADIHPALDNAHHVPGWVALMPTVAAAGGIAVAYLLYVFAPALPGILARTFPALHRFLLNKWYFDELYDAVLIRPAFRLGRGLWKGGDGALIDGLGPDGVAATSMRMGRKVAATETGYLFHYAFAMLIGVAGLVTWYMAIKN